MTQGRGTKGVVYAPAVSSNSSDLSPGAPPNPGVRGTWHAVVPYVAVAVAAVTYSLLALRRVWELKANAFDAGFINNVLYKVSSGFGDVSGLTGVGHFVDHASPLLLLAIPLYWIDASHAYAALLVLQAVSVAMVGLAVWLIAEALGLTRGRRYAALLYALASPAAYWAIITELHLTGLSMGLVAMTVAGTYRRWRLRYFWVLPFLASLARIEIALTVVVVGLLLIPVSRSHSKTTIAIGATIAGVLAVFMIAAPEQGSSVGAHFEYLGVESVSQVPMAALRQPVAVIRQLLDPVFMISAFVWFVLAGIVLPYRSSRWLLVGVPMLLVAAIGSPWFADLWYQHYWNFLFVGAAIAFVLSLGVSSWSDRGSIALAVVVTCAAWFVPSMIYISPSFSLFYPAASDAEHQAAAVATSTSGSLSTMSTLVLPGSQREWVYLFPNPFACSESQFAYFARSGPAPDVVITAEGWEDLVSPADLNSVLHTFTQDYEVADTVGPYTVRRILPGASPLIVDECKVVVVD